MERPSGTGLSSHWLQEYVGVSPPCLITFGVLQYCIIPLGMMAGGDGRESPNVFELTLGSQ